MASRYPGDDACDEVRRYLRHASSGTGRAKPAAPATEGHQQLLLAGVTAQAEKPVRQKATSQIVVKLASDLGRQAHGIWSSLARGEQGLQVLCDHVVEHRAAGIPRYVGGHRWRHTSPHGQVGRDGSARSCQQLHCSFVQYTSEMFPRRCGGNTGTHHHAAAATLRCPRGGWQKVRLKFLYTPPSGRARIAGVFPCSTHSYTSKDPDIEGWVLPC